MAITSLRGWEVKDPAKNRRLHFYGKEEERILMDN